MKEIFKDLNGKYEKTIEGGSLLGILLRSYEDQGNPIIIKMRDEKGDYTREYKTGDVLSKGYEFSLLHKKLQGKNVAYISDNHVDIMAVDIGCWINQKYTTGFYKNDSLGHISFKIIDSDVDTLVVNEAGLQKILELPSDLKKLFKKVFLLEGTELPKKGHGFSSVEKLQLSSDNSVISKIDYPDPEEVYEQVIKVVYTSGSTGNPKGVPITNKNCLYAAFGFIRSMFEGLEGREICPFFLPNAHIFQSSIFGLSYTGSFLGYITSKETFLEDLPKIKPTFLFGVPLLYQTLAHRVEEKLTNILGGFFKEKDLISPTWKNKLFIKPILSKIIKKKLGFTRLKSAFSGGAALNGKTYDIFEHVFGIKITEGYGMSETTCTLTSSKIGKKGSCGKRAIVNEVEIREKGDKGIGEVWVKGNNVFSGYLNHSLKDDFDENGWFNTGDRGYFDEDGYLFLRGRSKHFVKAADGRFYNIEAIAEKILEKSSFIQQVVVHILNSPTPIGIITLGEDSDSAVSDPQTLRNLFSECLSIVELLEKEKFYPIPKKFILVPPFTEENGFLTPTKKTKSLKVISFYEEAINAFQEKKGITLCYLDETNQLKPFGK